jgi:integrase
MNRPKGTGCIYRREGSAFWWIKYSRNGKPFLESSHSTEKSRAKNLLKKRLGEIENGSFIGPKSERTMVSDLVEDLFREYRINGLKSLDDAKARWDLHLEKFFRGRRAVDVSSSLLKEYQDKRQEESASNASINRELAVLRRMFTLGRQHRKVREIPIFPHLRENNTRKGFLEDGAFRKIVESRRELWFRCIVELGKTYGWRISELLNLRVKQVDLFSRTIRLEVGTTKNDEGREVSASTIRGPTTTALHARTESPSETSVTLGTPPVVRRIWASSHVRSAGTPSNQIGIVRSVQNAGPQASYDTGV